jgi:starch synthase
VLEKSSIKDILLRFKKPFAFPNGIPKAEKRAKFEALCGCDHLKAKELIQKKYFNYQKLNDEQCLFGFVGRITKQKGILLILNIVEKFLDEYGGNAQFFIGGPISPTDPYGQECAKKMKYLREKFPWNFWADPFLFFRDGELLTLGCDFGMMPSAFEPGGIVQHEFFVANTPVVAFKTGGLKDTVFNYSRSTRRGNGFVFEDYDENGLYAAFENAYKLFQDKKHYKIARENAYDGAIDIADQGISWNKEFYRLFNRV